MMAAAKTPAQLLREIDIRNRAARLYDQAAEELAELGDEFVVAGAFTMAQECYQLAYIAARASHAEHTDPEPAR